MLQSLPCTTEFVPFLILPMLVRDKLQPRKETFIKRSALLNGDDPATKSYHSSISVKNVRFPVPPGTSYSYLLR